MAGYSGTPLWKKLGIKPGQRLHVRHPPDHYLSLVAPLPEGVVFAPRLTGKFPLVHLFVREASGLTKQLEHCLEHLVPDGSIWVSWPKQAAQVATDVTEAVIRAAALPLGLVDTKVCAVDETWSGLKLVIRVAQRKT